MTEALLALVIIGEVAIIVLVWRLVKWAEAPEQVEVELPTASQNGHSVPAAGETAVMLSEDDELWSRLQRRERPDG